MRLAPLVLFPALLLAAACGSDKKAPLPANTGPAPAGQLPQGHPPVGQLPPGHPPMPGGDGTGRPAAGRLPVVWTAPEGWEATPPANMMRVANFLVAEVDGRPVEVVVFGGAIGGSAEQNIARWLAQFDFASEDAARAAADVRQTERDGLTITRLDVAGSYGGMRTSGVEHAGGAGYRMLAVVVEGLEEPLFVKLVGPGEVVGPQEGAFDAFVASIKKRS